MFLGTLCGPHGAGGGLVACTAAVASTRARPSRSCQGISSLRTSALQDRRQPSYFRRGRGRSVAAQASTTPARKSRSGAETLIKVCGVVCAEDALTAVRMGADFIGMIVWPKAKRSVSSEVASEIAKVAVENGAEPVGVFVDEDAATIAQRCSEAGIAIAQLHGDGARAALPDLPGWLKVIYVVHADPQGAIQTPLPASWDDPGCSHNVAWVLVDGLKGGSGETFDWTKLSAPRGSSDGATNGWLLAGGLGPHNVAEAINIAHPTGVDVSSGVAGPDGLRKDTDKVAGFVEAIKHA